MKAILIIAILLAVTVSTTPVEARSSYHHRKA
jgi:hypothetical protein